MATVRSCGRNRRRRSPTRSPSLCHPFRPLPGCPPLLRRRPGLNRPSRPSRRPMPQAFSRWPCPRWSCPTLRWRPRHPCPERRRGSRPRRWTAPDHSLPCRTPRLSRSHLTRRAHCRRCLRLPSRLLRQPVSWNPWWLRTGHGVPQSRRLPFCRTSAPARSFTRPSSYGPWRQLTCHGVPQRLQRPLRRTLDRTCPLGRSSRRLFLRLLRKSCQSGQWPEFPVRGHAPSHPRPGCP